MPPTSLPPGDPDNEYKARIKIRGVDDFGSESFLFLTVKVRNVSSRTRFQSFLFSKLLEHKAKNPMSF